MQLHCVKIQKKYWNRIKVKEKNCEIRFNDRDYQKGDRLHFEVLEGRGEAMWSFSPKEFFEITHVLYFPAGLKEDYVCLSLKEIDPNAVHT
jgi:hypothetical protein